MKGIQALWLLSNFFLLAPVVAGHPGPPNPEAVAKEEVKPRQHSGTSGSERSSASHPGEKDLAIRDGGQPATPLPITSGWTSMDIDVPGHDHALQVHLGFLIVSIYVFSRLNTAWAWYRSNRPQQTANTVWRDDTRDGLTGSFSVIAEDGFRGTYLPWQATDRVNLRLEVQPGREEAEGQFNRVAAIPIQVTLFSIPPSTSDGVVVQIPGGIDITIFRSGPAASFVLIRNLLARDQVIYYDNQNREGTDSMMIPGGHQVTNWYSWLEGDWIRWSSPPPSQGEAGPSNLEPTIVPLEARQLCFYLNAPPTPVVIEGVTLAVLHERYVTTMTVENMSTQDQTFYIRIRREPNGITASTLVPGERAIYEQTGLNDRDIVEFRVLVPIPTDGQYQEPSRQTTVHVGLPGTTQRIRLGYLDMTVNVGEQGAELVVRNMRTGGPHAIYRVQNLRLGIQFQYVRPAGTAAAVVYTWEPHDTIIIALLSDNDPAHNTVILPKNRRFSARASEFPPDGSVDCI